MSECFFWYCLTLVILDKQVVAVVTGSIARSANLPVFRLLRGQF